MRSSFISSSIAVVAMVAAIAQASAAEPALSPVIALPQTTLQKVRAKGFVQCGSVSRPGLALADAANKWVGLEVEICRAVATAVLGPDARFGYHKYESTKDFDSARSGADDISFLTFAEMLEENLTDKLAPGPTVFVESHDLIVAVDSPVKHPADLAGEGICFIIATPPEASLQAWYQQRKIDIVPNAYREDGEMEDAYQVQRCKSLVGESTTLAQTRRNGGVNHLRSRFIPDHLAAFPIVAATPVKDDAQWAAIVAWTIDTLLNANGHETNFRPSGLRAMEVAGAGLGLDTNWQKAVVDRVGSYAAIFDRTLGAGSPLKLEPGLNRTLEDGGVLLPPFKF